MKLKLTDARIRPIATPARKARGNDTIPAMTAAASARPGVLGRGVVRAEAERGCAAVGPSDSVAGAPAMAHTMVEGRFGLMRARRARSGFSAGALTLLPGVVRERNQPGAIATSG